MSGANEQYAGGVFHASLQGGRSGAAISLTGSAALALTPEGQRFVVEYAGAELSLGGASGKMWFCRSKDRETTIFSEAPGFAAALREAGQRDLVERLDALEHAARDAVQRYLWMLSGIAVLGFFLVTAGLYVARHAGQLALRALPTSADQQVGKLALENMDLGGSVAYDPMLKGAVKTVISRLHRVQRSRFQFEARIINSSSVNAFALPGGPIIVYTGLLREARSADELAGVLAHEMAHVIRRHGMQRIGQSLGLVAGVQLLFGDVSGVMAVAVEVLRAGAINSYSRDQEREADMDAVERMRAAQLDPGALADFFQRLAKQEGSLTVPAWLGTHPDLKERVKAVRKRVEHQTESEPKPISIEWAEVRRHAGADPDNEH